MLSGRQAAATARHQPISMVGEPRAVGTAIATIAAIAAVADNARSRSTHDRSALGRCSAAYSPRHELRGTPQACPVLR